MEVICRLCAEISSADDIICTIDDHDLNIRQKLVDCCRWDELHHHTNDVFPKSICKTCYGRLELCWNFSKAVSRAQFRIFQFAASGGDVQLLQVQPEVKEEAIPCFVESLPIVNNPLESVFVKMEDEDNPLEDRSDVNPFDLNPSGLDLFGSDANPSPKVAVKPISTRSKAATPIVSQQNIDIFVSTAQKSEPPKEPEPEQKPHIADMDSDNDDFFGSTASVSSLEDAFDDKSAVDVASSMEAYTANAIQMKRSFKSKVLSRTDYLALTKNGCNPDGSLTGEMIERLQLVNWSLLQEICWQCKFVASDRKMLRMHIRTEHPLDEVRTICTLCPNKSFSSRYPLMRHTQSEHFPYLEFCCHKCEVLFNGKMALKKHKCAEPEEKKTSFICELCGTVLKNAGTLKSHMETHKPKSQRQNFECYLCKQTGFLKRTLERHMKDHTTTNTRKYACSFCGRAFTSKSSIQRHEMIHTNTFPFTCTFCGKGFRDKGGCTIHERKHTGERPYKCTVCEYRSREQPNMDKHMTQQHGISWYKNRRKPFKLPEPKSNKRTITHTEPESLMQPSTSTFPFGPPSMPLNPNWYM